MTQQTPYPPTPQPQAPPQPRNGLGTTGFVLGLIGLVFSPIPFIGVVAWPLVILGLVFSAIGLSHALKGKATNKGLAIAGVAVSVVGLIVCIVWVLVFNKAVEEVNRLAKVTYEVTGDAKDVDIMYGETLNPTTETAAGLPWRKDVENKGVFKGGTLTVTLGEGGGSVTCKITVDGNVVSTKTAKGPYAVAPCTG